MFEGADSTGLEEDARLTAMWLWTLSTGANEDVEEGSNSEDDDESSSGAAPMGSPLSSMQREKSRRVSVLTWRSFLMSWK